MLVGLACRELFGVILVEDLCMLEMFCRRSNTTIDVILHVFGLLVMLITFCFDLS